MSTRIATDSDSIHFDVLVTGNPLVYEDCNGQGTAIWTMALPGNPLVYEDCNCKIFVICECYSTKDLLSYGGKCKKYLHGAKALDLIPITFYYRTNSPWICNIDSLGHALTFFIFVQTYRTFHVHLSFAPIMRFHSSKYFSFLSTSPHFLCFLFLYRVIF